MPVEAGTSDFTYLGDGVTTTFPFPSRFFSDADLSVGVNNVEQSPSTYTVSGAGSATGGSVTFTVAPATGAEVLLLRKPEASQLVDFVNGQTILEGTLDNAFDRLTMLIQYVLRLSERTVRIGDLDTSVDMTLPAKADRVSKLFGFDASGEPTMVVPAPSGNGLATFDALLDATAAGKAVGRAANAAAQRLLLSVYSKSETDALFTGLATDAELAAAIANSIVAGNRITISYAAGQFTISGPTAADLVEAGAGISFTAGTGGKTKINNSRDISVGGLCSPVLGCSDHNWSAFAILSADKNRIYAAGQSYVVGNLPNFPDRFIQLSLNKDNARQPVLPWAKVITGPRMLFAIDAQGYVFAIGDNAAGNLGLGVATNPVQALSYVAGAGQCSDVVVMGGQNVTSGNSSVYFLRTDGTLYACGPNTAGQLGDNSTTQRTTPVRCGTLTNVTKVVARNEEQAGRGVVYAISNGGLYAWGSNFNGVVGDGTTNDKLTPYLSLAGVIDIDVASDYGGAAGVYWASALAVKSDFTIRAIGKNNGGQLGDGTTTDRSAWVTPAITNVKRVFTRNGTSYFWFNDNTVKCCGRNTQGETGNGNTTSPQTALVTPAGAFQGAVADIVVLPTSTSSMYSTWGLRTTAGDMWAVGYNGHGQIGDGTTTAKSLWQKIGLPAGETVAAIAACGQTAAGAFAMLCASGRLFFTGYNSGGTFGCNNNLAYNNDIVRPVEPDYPM